MIPTLTHPVNPPLTSRQIAFINMNLSCGGVILTRILAEHCTLLRPNGTSLEQPYHPPTTYALIVFLNYQRLFYFNELFGCSFSPRELARAWLDHQKDGILGVLIEVDAEEGFYEFVEGVEEGRMVRVQEIFVGVAEEFERAWKKLIGRD
ncbi:MAG: hypothetical protein MMC23_001010 [Stictis urceolatum]|nr:hypothetical protein [Stictis urceolata]